MSPIPPCSDRATTIDVSGIRRAFQLGAKLEDPINLSIGQPDFPVPQQLKDAAVHAINDDQNGYTLTAGNPQLLDAIKTQLHNDVGWTIDGEELDVMVTSGTSGGLLLSFMAMLNPGDEAIVADPYFVVYTALGPMTGSTIRLCDTYPDFRMTAERVEPLITDRTKVVLVNSPANPTGVVLDDSEMKDLAELCNRRGILLISDEIYDLFTWPEHLDQRGRCPSPANHTKDMLLAPTPAGGHDTPHLDREVRERGTNYYGGLAVTPPTLKGGSYEQATNARRYRASDVVPTGSFDDRDDAEGTE